MTDLKQLRIFVIATGVVFVSAAFKNMLLQRDEQRQRATATKGSPADLFKLVISKT
jgi:hypothetical protein